MGLPGSLWAHWKTCSRLPIGTNPSPCRTRSAKAAADSLIAYHTRGTRRLLTDIDWGEFPRHYPAFESVHVARNGEVWVRRTLTGGLIGFDVFAPDGRYLGQPLVPPGLGTMEIQVITESGIYAIDTDDDDVEYVVQFDVSGIHEPRAATGFLIGCRRPPPSSITHINLRVP